jgi:uncharacterized membrane protein
MTARFGFPDRLNSYLAWLLGLGSWVSCVVIATGVVLPILDIGARSGAGKLVSIGIAVLIALPTLRVATMWVWFLVHRNFDFALIAGLVLTNIVVSTLLGVRLSGCH